MKLLTYNINRHAKGRAGTFMRDKVAPTFDVVALQEALATAAETASGLRGWRGFATDTANPVYVNPERYAVEFHGRLFLTEATHVGKRGAGPSTLREKEATVVALRKHDKIRWTWVLNVHNAPSIHFPERDVLHEEQVRDVLSFAKRQRGRQLIVGDFNAVWEHENLDPFRAAGAAQYGPDAPTHGKRRIDYFIGLGAFAQRDAGVFSGLVKGDHDAPWVDLDG